MSTIKELKNRIHSVSSIEQITQAMKMVSTSKLHKVQQNFQANQQYLLHLKEVYQNVLPKDGKKIQLNTYFKPRKKENIAILSVGTHKGLCGAFNTKIFKKTIETLKEIKIKNPEARLHIYPIGEKLIPLMQKESMHYQKDYIDLNQNLNFDLIASMSDKLQKNYENHTLDEILVLYYEFENLNTQNVNICSLLPLTYAKEHNTNPSDLYIYENPFEEILHTLITWILRSSLYHFLTSSATSEHAIRIVNMTKATDNAKNLIQDLNLDYNRKRQSVITKEISEIVAGVNG